MNPAPSLEDHPMASTHDAEEGSARPLALARPSLLGAERRSTMDRRQAAGFAAIGLGALGIVVAWFQIAGERELWKQLPYLASGGIGGAAAIAIGIALLIAYEHSADRAALDIVLDRLDAIDDRLDSAPSDAAPAGLEDRIAELEAALADLRRPRTGRAPRTRAAAGNGA